MPESKEVPEVVMSDGLDESMPKNLECPQCGGVVYYKSLNSVAKCPHCSERWWNKPPIEYSLFKLQDRYLAGEKEVISQMFEILHLYCKKIGAALLLGKVHLSTEELSDSAHDGASYLSEQFLTREDFMIDQSFWGYLNLVMRGVLFGSKDRTSNISLNYYDEVDEGASVEENLYKHSSTLKSLIDSNQHEVDRSDHLISKLSSIMKKISNKIKENYSRKDSYLLILSLLIKLKNKKENLDELYKIYGYTTKENLEKTMLLLFKYLKTSVEV